MKCIKNVKEIYMTYGDGIIGREYSLRLPCGTTYRMGPTLGVDSEAKASACNLLTSLGYRCTPDDINFEWDGRM